MSSEVDNIEEIKKLLVFDSEDDFYQLQIIKRRKENPGLRNNAKHIVFYEITSIEYLEEHYEDIRRICAATKSRAYINLNRRSFRLVAHRTLQKLTDQMMNYDYKSVSRAHWHAVSGASSEPRATKKWIVDIDIKDGSIDGLENYTTSDIIKSIEDVQDNADHGYTMVETPNGVHLIVSPFNTFDYSIKYPDFSKIDIKRNSPTILYSPLFLIQ